MPEFFPTRLIPERRRLYNEGNVPQAIVCFLEGEDFEDTIRNAISLGGDGDTQAAIAGSIAEAFFGIPEALQEEAMTHVDDVLADYIAHWSEP